MIITLNAYLDLLGDYIIALNQLNMVVVGATVFFIFILAYFLWERIQLKRIIKILESEEDKKILRAFFLFPEPLPNNKKKVKIRKLKSIFKF